MDLLVRVQAKMPFRLNLAFTIINLIPRFDVKNTCRES
jgi:hypothetical protein